MADWKSGLRHAAEELALDSKSKTKIPDALPVAAASQQQVEDGASERPAVPSMPGKPGGLPAQQERPEAPWRGKGRGLESADVRNRSTESADRGKNKKPAYRPRTRFPPPLAPPLRKAIGRRATNYVPASTVPARANTPRQEALQETEFRAPDMARYTIWQGSSDSCDDQSWQVETSTTLGQAHSSNKAQCTIGLDFGTAFTKACVQFRQSTFVVHWERAISHATPFLLPSVFTVRLDGVCVLGSEPNGRVQGDLKMGLLTSATLDSKIKATAFLALATRYIRWWLSSKYANVFKGFQIEWSVNVGLPAVPWDNLQLRELYKGIGLAGWRLGAKGGNITMAAAASALSKVHDSTPQLSDQLHSDRVSAFPEFVAQINSYRRSSQRRRDLHLLVDVGAGTVDMVTFHAWEPQEGDCYSILDASVESMGTHVLLGYRADASGLKLNRLDERLSRASVREFEAEFGLSEGKIGLAQRNFVDQIRWFLEKLLRRTRSTRYGTSPTWESGVPFFLSGGGNSVDAYREAIEVVRRDWCLEEIQLPWPEGLVEGSLKLRDFHRISVAHGLSDSADNIGLIERKSEVPDLYRAQKPGADYSDRYIEK